MLMEAAIKGSENVDECLEEARRRRQTLEAPASG